MRAKPGAVSCFAHTLCPFSCCTWKPALQLVQDSAPSLGQLRTDTYIRLHIMCERQCSYNSKRENKDGINSDYKFLSWFYHICLEQSQQHMHTHRASAAGLPFWHVHWLVAHTLYPFFSCKWKPELQLVHAWAPSLGQLRIHMSKKPSR